MTDETVTLRLKVSELRTRVRDLERRVAELIAERELLMRQLTAALGHRDE